MTSRELERLEERACCMMLIGARKLSMTGKNQLCSVVRPVVRRRARLAAELDGRLRSRHDQAV